MESIKHRSRTLTAIMRARTASTIGGPAVKLETILPFGYRDEVTLHRRAARKMIDFLEWFLDAHPETNNVSVPKEEE